MNQPLLCLAMAASIVSACTSGSQVRTRVPADFEAQVSVEGVPTYADAWLVSMEHGDGPRRPTILIEGFRETTGGIDVTSPARELRGALRFTANEQGLVALGSLDDLNPMSLMDGTGVEGAGFLGPVENLMLSLSFTLDVSASGSAALGDNPRTPGPTNVNFAVSGTVRTACGGIGSHGVDFEHPRTGSEEVEIEGGRVLVIHCDGSGFEVR